MTETPTQESSVSDAFSRQAAVFDDIYGSNPIEVYMREKVRNEVLKYIKRGNTMLELNCGTGMDTIFFARMGYKILATDNAEGMLQQLVEKMWGEGLADRIAIQKCSFNDLSPIGYRQFDYLLSNFAGLNCTDDLGKVLKNINELLKPGGHFTFVIMPKVCPWELAMILKGRAKRAFRRFKKNGTRAHIEGVYFNCWYYNPSFVIEHVAPGFKLCAITGLASLMPVPSMDYFPSKYPRLYSFLQKAENSLCTTFPFNRWCDQYIITMRKEG